MGPLAETPSASKREPARSPGTLKETASSCSALPLPPARQILRKKHPTPPISDLPRTAPIRQEGLPVLHQASQWRRVEWSANLGVLIQGAARIIRAVCQDYDNAAYAAGAWPYPADAADLRTPSFSP